MALPFFIASLDLIFVIRYISVVNSHKKSGHRVFCDRLHFLEATSGFEPLNNGFADHCLTSWLRRLNVRHLYHRFIF